MKRQIVTSSVSVLLILLIAAAAMLTGCAPQTTVGDATIIAEKELGTGATTIVFTVVNPKNEATVYTIKTDAENLRGALTENGLIPAGNAGDMVVTVDGITADYSVDQGWWKLLIDGEVANVGVDDCIITAGGQYAFVYTRGF